jgi:hypothetical protein
VTSRAVFLPDSTDDLIGVTAVSPAVTDLTGANQCQLAPGRVLWLTTFARAYVALSPGSFSDESIAGIDTSGARWLLIASREDRFLQEITAAVVAQTRTADIMLLPGRAHASDLLEDRSDLVPRIVAWLHQALGRE